MFFFPANSTPTLNLKPWLLSQGAGKTASEELAYLSHDIYVIGTQESATIDKEWIAKIKDNLYGDFYTVSKRNNNINSI